MFKVVSRDRKTNRQVKKRIYETNRSFDTYAFDIIMRYTLWYQVEVYEMNFETEDWVKVKTFLNKREFDEAVDSWEDSKATSFINMIKGE